MTVMSVDELVAAIRTWPEAERRWWRQLLDVAPHEAILTAEIAALLDATPVDENLLPLVNPDLPLAGPETPRMPPILAPGGRVAPDVARELRERLAEPAAETKREPVAPF